MADLPEHEGRQIRDYVNGQSPPDDQARLVQKVGSQRIVGRVHEMYDVHCEASRWWVITEPMNLYSQVDFPEVEQALIYHLGLGLYLAQRARGDLDETDEEAVVGSWRRFRQALTAMDDAAESEDFQAIGIKCRDALIAFASDHARDDWVGIVSEPPKGADFKRWGAIFAERLAENRVRSYVKVLVEKVWDIAVALQHNNATPDDAELVLDATGHLLMVFGRLIRQHTLGEPARCPRCGSYRIDDDVELADEPESGFTEVTRCSGCGWHSEPEFTSWADHYDGVEVDESLFTPKMMSPSHRLHHDEDQ